MKSMKNQRNSAENPLVGTDVYDYCSKRLNINGLVQQPVDIEEINNRSLLTENPNTFFHLDEIGSADGIRTHITLIENELSLLPLDDDATIKTGAISGQCSTGLPVWIDRRHSR